MCQPNECFKNILLYVSKSDDKLIQWTIACACFLAYALCKYGWKSWEILNLVLSGFKQVDSLHVKVKKYWKSNL